MPSATIRTLRDTELVILLDSVRFDKMPESRRKLEAARQGLLSAQRSLQDVFDRSRAHGDRIGLSNALQVVVECESKTAVALGHISDIVRMVGALVEEIKGREGVE